MNLPSFVRSEAIGKPIIFDEDAAFIVMRFSQNDENDNAYKYGIKDALEKLNIKAVRADNSISSGQLLEKIQRNIEKSRYVIAKVDSDNLNVYFELGLAMGLDKDVLLISEKELVLQLPSDLRNWECLTYSKGNYEELKENVIRYFKDNYYSRMIPLFLGGIFTTGNVRSIRVKMEEMDSNEGDLAQIANFERR